MAVKNPGKDNASGSRNKRVNRFAVSDGNDPDIRHKVVAGTGIAFGAPDLITDTGNGLGGFEVGEFIDVEGSVAQDGTYEVATVVAGQLDLVEQTITLEAAGPAITLTSRNNRVESRFS